MMRHSHQTPPIHPFIALTFGILAVSTASIFIRFAQAYAPSLVIAAYRMTLASIALAPLASAGHRTEIRSLSPKDLLLALLSGIFLALHFATWITSLEYTNVASSVVLVTTTPLWVAMLSPFTIKERLTRPIFTGMGLALVGGIIIGLSDTCSISGISVSCPPLAEFIRGDAFKGDMLALAGGLMAALYILIGRNLRGKMSLIAYIFVAYAMAAVALVVIMLAAGLSPWGYPAPAYLWFVLLAAVPQLLGHSTFNWALRYLSAAYISITLLGEPIGSTILAYFLLAETPTVIKIFGAILILVGIYIASRSSTSGGEQSHEQTKSSTGREDN